MNSNIGICYMKISQPGTAIQYFDSALESNPIFIKARVNWAKCHVKVNDHENAMKDFEEIKK